MKKNLIEAWKYIYNHNSLQHAKENVTAKITFYSPKLFSNVLEIPTKKGTFLSHRFKLKKFLTKVDCTITIKPSITDVDALLHVIQYFMKKFRV